MVAEGIDRLRYGNRLTALVVASLVSAEYGSESGRGFGGARGLLTHRHHRVPRVVRDHL